MFRKTYGLFLACLVVASCALVKNKITPDKWDSLPIAWRSATAWECTPRSELSGMQVLMYPKEKKVLSRTVGGTDTIDIEDDIDSIFYDHTNEKLEITIKSIPNFERSIQWSIDTNTGISEKATHNAAYGVGLYKYRCFPQQKS